MRNFLTVPIKEQSQREKGNVMNIKDDMRLHIMNNKPLTEPVQLLFNLALVELFDPSRGYCEATMQDIADAMGRTRRSLQEVRESAIDGLWTYEPGRYATRGIYRPLFKSEHK